MEVVNAEAERFTMLFPIKIALNILEGSSVILSTFCAFLLPSSAKLRILILFTVVKLVSADEKNADNINKIINTIICMAALVSTFIITPSMCMKIYIFQSNIHHFLPICKRSLNSQIFCCMIKLIVL